MSKRFADSDLRDRFDGAERYIRGLGRAIPDVGDVPDLIHLRSLQADIEAATTAAVLGFRAQGMSWALIGAALGITEGAAWKAWGKGLPKTATCKTCGVVFEHDSKGGRPSYCAEHRPVRVELSAAERRAILDRDLWLCGICGEPITQRTYWNTSDAANVDHIVEVADGGSSDPSNLQASHVGCNRRKAQAARATREAEATVRAQRA